MKVGIMQPYFMPYIGYFQLMKAVDKYVVYDDVQYIKGGWINRNNLIVNGEKKLFTIELSGASSNKLINEIDVRDNFTKFKKTLAINYGKAPFYLETMELLETIFSFQNKNLGAFMLNSFQQIFKYLNITNTTFILSSELEKDKDLKAEDKVLDICTRLNATHYYNAIGGQELYSKQAFLNKGIELKFFKTNLDPYSQINSKEFVPGLSMIDVLMNNSVGDVNKMLDNYTLL